MQWKRRHFVSIGCGLAGNRLIDLESCSNHYAVDCKYFHGRDRFFEKMVSCLAGILAPQPGCLDCSL